MINITYSKSPNLIKRHWKKLVFGIPIIALTIYLAPILILIGKIIHYKYDEYTNRIEFDSTTWKDPLTQETEEQIRIRMVDDLLGKHQLLGKKQSEIIQLLGEPPKTRYFKNYDYVYWLGDERSAILSLDSEWLVLKFNDELCVSKIDLVSD